MSWTSCLPSWVSIAMITGPQIRAARALLGIDQRALAEMAGLSVPTIQRMEASGSTVGGTVGSLTRVVTAIEGAGVELITDGGASIAGGRGVRLRQMQATRPDDALQTNRRDGK
jgi:transcriptional regulator with XRE-family HTH domain